MAPGITVEEQLNFVLICLQTALDAGGKVNFESVAEIMGIEKPRQAYIRLWTLKKKAGLEGGVTTKTGPVSSGGGVVDDGGVKLQKNKTPAKKRGRPAGIGAGKGRKTKGQKTGEEVTATGAEGGDDDAEGVAEETLVTAEFEDVANIKAEGEDGE